MKIIALGERVHVRELRAGIKGAVPGTGNGQYGGQRDRVQN